MRFLRACAAALFGLVFLTSPLSSQRPDQSLSVNPQLLRLKTDTFAVYLIRGSDTVQTGMVVDELRAQNQELIRIYSAMDRVLGDRLDTIVSSFSDLRPRAYRTISSQQIARLAFDKASVMGWARLPNGDSTSVNVNLPPVAYDGTSFDLIARASPLAEGFGLTVPAFLLGPNTIVRLSGSVTGSEPIDGRGCWVFKANFAGLPVTFWIDKETRALRQQLMQMRADMAILFRLPIKMSPGVRAT